MTLQERLRKWRPRDGSLVRGHLADHAEAADRIDELAKALAKAIEAGVSSIEAGAKMVSRVAGRAAAETARINQLEKALRAIELNLDGFTARGFKLKPEVAQVLKAIKGHARAALAQPAKEEK